MSYEEMLKRRDTALENYKRMQQAMMEVHIKIEKKLKRVNDEMQE